MADSGTSFAFITQASFDRIINTLNIIGIKCSKNPQGRTICNCKDIYCSDVPLLQIVICSDQFCLKTKTLYANYKSYATYIKSTNSIKLQFTIFPRFERGVGSQKDDDSWTLGNHFMRQYYTIFDYENKLFGIIESKDYNLDAPSTETNKITTLGISTLTLYLSFCICFTFICVYQRRQIKNKEN